MADSQPLLSEVEVEDQRDITVQTALELALNSRPEEVIDWLQDFGLEKLGDFTVHDTAALDKFKEDDFLITGCEQVNPHYKDLWRSILYYKNEAKPDIFGEGMLNVQLDAYVVTVDGAAYPGGRGILSTVLRLHQQHLCPITVFSLPAVRAVIDYKWRSFARNLVYTEFVFYILWLAFFTAFTLLFQSEDEQMPLADLMKTRNGPITALCMVLAVCCMMPFIFIEMSTISFYRSGWANIWNLMDVALYSLQILSAVTYFRRWHLDNQLLALGMAMQHVIMWFRIQYFSRAFPATRFSFVDSIRNVMVEIKWYLFFMALLWWGFAIAFHTLFREDKHFTNFSTIQDSLVTVFCFSMAGSLPTQMQNKGSSWEALALAMVFQFLMSVILMKLLIGVMSGAVIKSNSHLEEKYLLSKAEVIDELETSIPRFLREYFIKWKWYPEYIHVLKINRGTVSEDEGSLIWKSASEFKAKDKSVSNEELAAKMGELQAQLATLAAQITANK